MIKRFKESLSSFTQHLHLLPRYHISLYSSYVYTQLLQTSDPRKDIIEPAIKGTTNMLEAALKSTKVKRVVITSSVASVIPPKDEDLALDHTYTG